MSNAPAPSPTPAPTSVPASSTFPAPSPAPAFSLVPPFASQNSNCIKSFAATSDGAQSFNVARLQKLDKDTASLILELAVRDPTIPDYVVNAVFVALPLSDPISPGLKKDILFRRLASDLARRSVSEKTLEIFELIEEIDRENISLPPSEAMKYAYCAVALSCTASALRQNVDAFFNSFHRIWVLRISDIEKSAAASLISENLFEVRSIIREAINDPKVRDLVLNVDLEETLDLVRNYLEQVWNMEPLFTGVESDMVVDDLRVSGEIKDSEGGLTGKLFNSSSRALKSKQTVSALDEELQGLKFQDEGQAFRPHVQRTPQDAPLDTANKATETLAKVQERKCDAESVGNDGQLCRDELAAAFEVNTSVEKVPAIILEEETCSTQNNHKPNSSKSTLMERNTTAQTFKWTDSPPQNGRVKLHSPRRDPVSPLKLFDDKAFARRRKNRKWTSLEEETLIKAVRDYGKGCWKFILKNNQTIFKERSEVDLKDKWRNMTK